MVDISLTLYTKGFFGSFLKSPTQMGSLSINNSVTNISRLGTFKVIDAQPTYACYTMCVPIPPTKVSFSGLFFLNSSKVIKGTIFNSVSDPGSGAFLTPGPDPE
jgi:hypothetical protein